MHIMEGYLPPAHAAAWTLVAAPFVVHGAREVVREVREHPERKLLLAAAGAFTFVLSAIKLPSVTGSSSHPTGTGLGAVLFRPPVMAFLGTVVLAFQALLLAHGGITTLGANVFSMAVVGPWAGYAAYRACARLPWWLGIFTAMALADLATYVTTSLQLAVAFPDPASGIPGAAAKFLGVFAVTQIPLALAEGVLGILIIRKLADVAGADLRALGLRVAPTGDAGTEPGTPPDATGTAGGAAAGVAR